MVEDNLDKLMLTFILAKPINKSIDAITTKGEKQLIYGSMVYNPKPVNIRKRYVNINIKKEAIIDNIAYIFFMFLKFS